MAMTALENIRLIAFDLDGTLIDRTVYIWQTLHAHFGSDPTQRRRAQEDFKQGRISYAEWFRIDLELLSEQGATREKILAVFNELKASDAAHTTLTELKRRGYILALISGSLDVLLEHFFPERPFDHVLINHLHFGSDGKIKGGQATRYDLVGKADGLVELARREGLSISQCAFVGDNVNDLHVMQAAGFSLGINVKHPDVNRVVDRVIQDNNIATLLSLFGPK
jgi:phosphoserine phosphatase